ncbi:Eukaryotic/viral aspartic protease [Phytophthora megakarya]|uniref:Eukaryotic/viral aspartic protease n=1 Tax=Phytophthora megakarya TaxID=4795 RepID=A0A225VRJ6_9STRA|nr:Eukaryotic/viral aspartic protease [Phytophthora megakarya]
MQSTRKQSAPGPTPSAPRYASPTPVSRHPTTDTVPQVSTDVAMESVSSRSSSRSKRYQKEDPDDLFDLDAGLTGNAAAVSTATAGTGVARVPLSAFPELKEFNEKDASEEKAHSWFNRLKSASMSDGMTGDEVCALFRDRMAGPARQWYSATGEVDKAVTDRVDGPVRQEQREHVELFINTLSAQEQEFTSRLTLMKVPDTVMLEKKFRARQCGLTREKKTLFGSNRFRQKTPTPTPTLARNVHAVHITTDDYDSGREGDPDDDQICDQDQNDEERANMFVTGTRRNRRPRAATSKRVERFTISQNVDTANRAVTPRDTAEAY